MGPQDAAPQDIETIAKEIRTVEPDAETGRGVRQVGSEEESDSNGKFEWSGDSGHRTRSTSVGARAASNPGAARSPGTTTVG